MCRSNVSLSSCIAISLIVVKMLTIVYILEDKWHVRIWTLCGDLSVIGLEAVLNWLLSRLALFCLQWPINNGAIGARFPGPRAPGGPQILNNINCKQAASGPLV